MKAPDFIVEMRAVESLKPNPRNYQRHSPEQIAALAKSLQTHGQQKNISISEDGTILAGHGLVEAAKSIGWSHLACKVYTGPAPEAWLVADNYLATLAEPDPQALTDLLKSLQAEGQLEMTGYGAEDLGELIAGLQGDEPPKEEGEVPEPQEGPTRVQPGEVWALGKHRVMCGDSGKAEDLDRLLDGQKLNLIVTSPPYAMQRKEQYGGVLADEYGAWFLPMAALWKARLADDGSFFLNIKEHCENGERHLYVKRLVIALREEGGWRFVDELCWRRRSYPGEYQNRFKNAWEPVFHFSPTVHCRFRPQSVLIPFKGDASALQTYAENPHRKSGSGSPFEIGGKRSYDGNGAWPENLIEMYGDVGGDGHAAAYPVGLPTFFLQAYSDEGDTVLDPFLGSGTTLIAAEQTGRVAYGMELMPKYCDVILARWESFTGEKAVRIHG